MQQAPVHDPARDRSHELGVRDRVEVAAEIGVDDFPVSGVDEAVHLPDGIECPRGGAIGVLFGRQVGLEDGLQDQHGRRLAHSFTQGGDA